MESIVALNIFLTYNYLKEGVLNMKIDKEKLFKRIKDEFTNSEIEVEELKDVCVYDDSYISGLADEIIKKIDDRLLFNLEEYINNQELSDIWIDKYCVNAILKMRNSFMNRLEGKSVPEDQTIYLSEEEQANIWDICRMYPNYRG